jgi:hypothetical protein
VTISLGGEIGEVGTENSTPDELRAFMRGFDRVLAEQQPGAAGSPRSRSSRARRTAGVVLADGSIADVALDLDTLRLLGEIARDEFGLAGAVQHGASTLPDTAFHNFPRTETAEIHLATNFQNMLYEHMPDALRAEIYAWLAENAKDERKATDSDEQFFYKTRKKAIGPFKRRLWDLPEAARPRSGGRTTPSSSSSSPSSRRRARARRWPRTCALPSSTARCPPRPRWAWPPLRTTPT